MFTSPAEGQFAGGLLLSTTAGASCGSCGTIILGWHSTVVFFPCFNVIPTVFRRVTDGIRTNFRPIFDGRRTKYRRIFDKLSVPIVGVCCTEHARIHEQDRQRRGEGEEGGNGGGVSICFM